MVTLARFFAGNMYSIKNNLRLETIEERGNEPLLILSNNLNGWPMISPDWNSSNFDWLELMAQLRLYNNDILLAQWVGPDIKSSSNYIVQVYFLKPLKLIMWEN